MPHKETRTILQIGNSVCVTLPKPWVEYFHLKTGDKVTVVSNGDLVVKLPHKKEPATGEKQHE